MFEAAVEKNSGSIIAAIEELRTGGRSLVPFDIPEQNIVEENLLAENELLDPERPTGGWKSLRRKLGWPRRHRV